MTAANLKYMQSWLDAEAAVGGTNFKLGFTKASEIFEASIAAGKTSGCLKTILFLTDGKDSHGFVPSDIKKLPGLKDVTILTYSFGPQADAKLPKAIACQNNGIWYHVKDKTQIGNVMTQYFQLFAAGIDSDSVRWTQYEDSVTGQKLMTGCLPAYDRSKNVPELVGVSCMDINIIISNEELINKPTFSEMLTKMKSITSTCPKLNFGASTLQYLRQQVGSSSVCKKCDDTDEGCDEAPVIESSPSPSPGPPSSNPSPGPTPETTGEASTTNACKVSGVSWLLTLLSLTVFKQCA